MTVRDLVQKLLLEANLDDEIHILDENDELTQFICYKNGSKGIVIEPVHPLSITKPESH